MCRSNSLGRTFSVVAALLAFGGGFGVSQAPVAAPPGMALIPEGSFEMGDHHGFVDPKHGGDETPLHTVRLDSFYMGINNVTNQDYCTFLNSALAQRQIQVRDGGVYLAGGNDLLCETRGMSPHSRIGWDGMAFSVLDNKETHPVVCIRWCGAAAYCNWCGERQKRPVCYDTATWACDFNRSGYRLPTEAEWEYAARGGQQNPYRNFPWGDEPDAAKANWPESGNPFRAGPEPWTTPAGFFNGQLHRKSDFNWPGAQETFQTANGVNGYGLYDMAGNVWQFVNDWYGRDYYAYSPAANPAGPDRGSIMPDGKPYRGMRGGNWYNGEHGHSRVSNRNPSYFRGPQDPDHPYYHMGFRVALPIDAEKRPPMAPNPVQDAGRGGREPDRGRTEDRAPPPPRAWRGWWNREPPPPPPPDQQDGRHPPRGKARSDGEGTLRGNRSEGRFAEDNKLLAGASPGQTVGLLLNTPKACDGYTLFAPKHGTMTYLINNEGQVVHQWTKSRYEPGQTVHLLENGHLLRCCFTHARGFTRGGEGGRLEEYDWDDNLLWEFDYATDRHVLHHDIAVLPSGNILALAVERKTMEECVAAGFDRRMLRDSELYPDYVIEIAPERPKGGKIVWEWHVWDHLVQDNAPQKLNYGVVVDHPERVDVNCNGRPSPAFWNHMNSIAHNAKLDQIMLSVRGCNELWVIDHSTTTAEATGHSGGRGGKGGDLLYRWGNPAAYGRGGERDRQFFQQHDARWIPGGSPGAGNIMVFNNGLGRGYSSVEVIVPPADADGGYPMPGGAAYGPSAPAWRYTSANRTDFYSSEISGAQRLPNGNTLVCAGVLGTFFEVTPQGETVWKYVNPVVRGGVLAEGEQPGVDDRGHYLNAVFKVRRYLRHYPGLAGRNLTPTGPIELPPSMKGKTNLDGVNTTPGRRPKGPERGDGKGSEEQGILRSLGYL